jgi:hypothetical protein
MAVPMKTTPSCPYTLAELKLAEMIHFGPTFPEAVATHRLRWASCATCRGFLLDCPLVAAVPWNGHEER